MNQGKGPWKGRSERKDDQDPTLQAAIENAWENAKEDGAEPGCYVVTRITIEANNPIHAYDVTINPGS